METTAQHPEPLTIRDVAGILKCSERQVRYLVTEGILPPPIKLGRLARWEYQDLTAALARARAARDQSKANLNPDLHSEVQTQKRISVPSRCIAIPMANAELNPDVVR